VPPDLSPASLGDHIDRLYRAAWAMCGSREDAEDLVQETFAQVLSRRRQIGTDDPLPYLLTVLRNTFISSLRRADRRPRTTPIEDAPEPVAPASDVLSAREVLAAVAALPDEQRDAIVAVDVAGLGYSEAASALGVPVGTIMSRLYRGRERIARTIGAP
jgi:RNA polymerase sigma-70 factor (ECF subfamily)